MISTCHIILVGTSLVLYRDLCFVKMGAFGTDKAAAMHGIEELMVKKLEVTTNLIHGNPDKVHSLYLMGWLL